MHVIPRLATHRLASNSRADPHCMVIPTCQKGPHPSSTSSPTPQTVLPTSPTAPAVPLWASRGKQQRLQDRPRLLCEEEPKALLDCNAVPRVLVVWGEPGRVGRTCWFPLRIKFLQSVHSLSILVDVKLQEHLDEDEASLLVTKFGF